MTLATMQDLLGSLHSGLLAEETGAVAHGGVKAGMGRWGGAGQGGVCGAVAAVRIFSPHHRCMVCRVRDAGVSLLHNKAI